MATGMDAVRRVTQAIAYFAGGIISLLFAIAAFKGVTFTSAGSSRSGPPSIWHVTKIESATAQLVLTAIYAVGGFWLTWRAYKKLKETDESRSSKKNPRKTRKQ
jgi:heme/copper-type cytochrome/quinol oxidase subunit 2